jgi:hypothetical protein
VISPISTASDIVPLYWNGRKKFKEKKEKKEVNQRKNIKERLRETRQRDDRLSFLPNKRFLNRKPN